MTKIAIYGSGSFGRELRKPMERALAGEEAANPRPADIVFVDDNEAVQGRMIDGTPVISYAQLAADKDRRVCVAIADPRARAEKVAQCEADGLAFHSFFDPGFSCYDEVEIGAGAIFCRHTMATWNVRIGRHFHCNIYSYVEHDCVIGDFVTFAPRVSCNGRVHIKDYAYIGSGAIIRQGVPGQPLTIGEGAVVGMGAVVTGDVPDGTTVVGNPARPMRNGK
jgi:sugar O-acyltransferase (sialic acid O-acetyltransferase NeuD family)